MSEWQIALSFSEGTSNKFWRARTDGSTLYVNFGRIGSDGQTQIKEFPSEDAAGKELSKLEKEKRKKGYADMDASASSGSDDEDEGDEEAEDEEEEAPKAKAAPPAPGRKVGAAGLVPKASAVEHADFALEADGRKINLRLTLEGSAVKTIVVDRYKSGGDAQAEFARLKEQMVSDGYKKVAQRESL